MRVKTDDRRQAFMRAALGVFQDVGFERASMSEIAARAGGSKATLYNYFKSKDELYAESILHAIAAQAAEVINILDPGNNDISTVLRDFGESYLRIVLSPEVIANRRTAISQSAHSRLGEIIYERGDRQAWGRVAAYLAHLMAAGELTQSDPTVAALHFQGLLECGMLEPCLYGAVPLRKIEDAASSAVAAFLMIYKSPSLKLAST
jgi:AcrR family transcriptional regulator